MNNDLPNRRSVRLKGYDYSLNGTYFVTICTQDRECLFGEIVNDPVGATRGSPAHMKLNRIGLIVDNVLNSLPNHHHMELNAYQIMPNHIHFVINLSGGSRPDVSGGSRPAPTVGNIVGLFKSECTKEIRRISNNTDLCIWQRNYYEHIVRDEGDLNRIQEYILNNPINWERDELFV
ncbi:hypothetical protein A3K29_03230 [Candidatus Collierbacteria bacterium RIFOXYB2_FULL_46_14]|uniref:Transposase IS200-like domain-containing protein n=1 Tax=Candidatus Collierbacteria bacterium GW2011_GWA2_46_26 TaxID=1618381 RepID=A0A0G1PM29_9BACT|nr:MAG: hypothetical protein UW29_C0004G0154 [Candidatus Collierbacteria bacterium GW2011_GWC2_44_13]KKU33796.1 MAG: hypothetical protein UX47_C0001G0079 [Candidatus Collierbacteria bacterium GW2011_GWA2_46_26]OGD73132.1 MAG: hypothetical protein A3K29_03230 [Candidatus Collierbacteria bacterium RIFOXYB2_FULL_46_14]OGD76174.1 MAG: hypothetical protein A3K43_03230 [Candidatus Collierbacteria bacterium RIFOXYA2_FULL_46_20]OGD77510.1 MAG: hypothetical protein A3K39_03230 [Candidatus Collierbacteri